MTIAVDWDVKNQTKSSPEDSAAICIQKWFRGYNRRKIDKTVFACFHFRGQIHHQAPRIQLPSAFRSGSEVTREGRFMQKDFMNSFKRYKMLFYLGVGAQTNYSEYKCRYECAYERVLVHLEWGWGCRFHH